MSSDQRPKDYWADARPYQAGPGFVVAYRVPWKAKPDILSENGKPKIFQQESDALRAAINHICSMMCPFILSSGAVKSTKAKAEAETLFKKRGGHVKAH